MMTLLKLAFLPALIAHKIMRFFGGYYMLLILIVAVSIGDFTNDYVTICIMVLAPLPLFFVPSRNIIRIVKKDKQWSWLKKIRGKNTTKQKSEETAGAPKYIDPLLIERYCKSVDARNKAMRQA